nr:integrase, catalytic region, zinc finger, CCHC-type, peptidase aspartic, catalytic [Tanacetum cinerariifolium]
MTALVLFKKVSDQKDNTHDTSENTKFAKQPIVENLLKFGETHALSKPVTSNSVSTPQESKGVDNDKVIAPGMFRINPFKTSREEKHVPNIVSASARTEPITVSQPPVFTKKYVNSDSNGLSFIGVDNTAKTRRTQARSSSKNNKVPYVVKSGYKKNKEADVEENHRNLLFSSNKKHEAAKFVGDFKSLANEADASLAKNKALELEIERLLKAVVSQDIMNIVQKEYVVDTSNLQTELERTKEHFENCIIKKENEYAKFWNDWYKKFDECKYDKISYDKDYKDMQQKIERLQAQLGDLKGKCKDTSCVSDTRNPLSQKLENENVSDQKENTHDTSENTKFAKQPIVENLPNVGETHALSKPVTSNSASTPQESKGVKNNKVITPGMFRINPFKTYRDEKHVPNTVRASDKKKPITVSQPLVITKKDVNSDVNGLSSTGVDNTKIRRPQPKSNTKNDRVSSASKSSRIKNKKAKVIQICLWCVDSGCSKHMTGNLKLLINFVWKFMGTVRFRNDHVAAILGFGDLQWGNILITRVYFVEGLGHNFFSVGQFCDLDLEIAFRRNACFVRNLEGVELLKGDRSTNLYTINLHEMVSASPICLMARASSTKSWNQLRSDGDMCIYALSVSTMELKNVKEAMTDPAWIDSMQEELLQFKRLDIFISLSLNLMPPCDLVSPPSCSRS